MKPTMLIFVGIDILTPMCARRRCLATAPGRQGGVEELELGGVQLVLDDEGAVLDPPQPLTGAERGQERLFRAGEPECCCGRSELVTLLAVDHAGLGVREQRRRECAHGGALVADVVEVMPQLHRLRVRIVTRTRERRPVA